MGMPATSAVFETGAGQSPQPGDGLQHVAVFLRATTRPKVAKALADVAAQGVGGSPGPMSAGGEVLGGGAPDRRQKGAGDEFVHLGAHPPAAAGPCRRVALDAGDGGCMGDTYALGEQAVEVLVGEYRVISLLHAAGQGLQQGGQVVGSRSESGGSATRRCGD